LGNSNKPPEIEMICSIIEEENAPDKGSPRGKKTIEVFSLFLLLKIEF
jgi:hypothetical protein